MKEVGSIIRFVVFSNIFISFCVLCFTAETSLMLFGNNGNIHVNLLAFFSTIFFYRFHAIYGSMRFKGNERLKQERFRWNVEHKKLNLIIIFFSFICAISQLLYIPHRVWFILIPAALITAGYSLPFIKDRNRFLRLRDILWLKALWIAFSYAWITTCLPAAFVLPIRQLIQPDIIFIFIRNFLFVFALAIPFDIRDMESDLKNGVRTLPVLLGVKGSVKLALILLFVFVSTLILQLTMCQLPLPVFLALIISVVEIAIVLPLSNTGRPNLFFPLAIESSMILQWILLYAFITLKI